MSRSPEVFGNFENPRNTSNGSPGFSKLPKFSGLATRREIPTLSKKFPGSRAPPNKTRRRSWNRNDQITSANSYLSREGLSCISPAASPRSLPAWSWPLDIPWERPTCPSCWGRTGPSSPPIVRWLFVGYLRQCSYLLVIGMRQAFICIRPGTIDRPDRSFRRTSIVWARLTRRLTTQLQ